MSQWRYKTCWYLEIPTSFLLYCHLRFICQSIYHLLNICPNTKLVPGKSWTSIGTFFLTSHQTSSIASPHHRIDRSISIIMNIQSISKIKPLHSRMHSQTLSLLCVGVSPKMHYPCAIFCVQSQSTRRTALPSCSKHSRTNFVLR